MWLRVIASSLLILCTANAQARINTNPNSFSTSTSWNGGDLQHQRALCVLSVSSPQPHATDVIPYAIEAAGPFTLNDGGANSIPVTLSWENPGSGQQQTLAPNTTTGEIFNGAIEGCPGGDNGALNISALASDIQAVPPGTYSNLFNFTATNSGSGKSSTNFTVSVEIIIPNSIQVTQIDDIPLGTFDGNDISRTDTLCVYQANGGQYAVTLTGSGSGGAFELASGGSSVPYAVSWNDGNGAQTASPGIPLPGMGNSRSGDPQCNGGASNNATVSIDVLANDISAATAAGVHSGVLTIMVEMQ